MTRNCVSLFKHSGSGSFVTIRRWAILAIALLALAASACGSSGSSASKAPGLSASPAQGATSSTHTFSGYSDCTASPTHYSTSSKTDLSLDAYTPTLRNTEIVGVGNDLDVTFVFGGSTTNFQQNGGTLDASVTLFPNKLGNEAAGTKKGLQEKGLGVSDSPTGWKATEDFKSNRPERTIGATVGVSDNSPSDGQFSVNIQYPIGSAVTEPFWWSSFASTVLTLVSTNTAVPLAILSNTSCGDVTLPIIFPSPLKVTTPPTSTPPTTTSNPSSAPTLPPVTAPQAPWAVGAVAAPNSLDQAVATWNAQPPGGPWSGCDLYAVTDPSTGANASNTGFGGSSGVLQQVVTYAGATEIIWPPSESEVVSQTFSNPPYQTDADGTVERTNPNGSFDVLLAIPGEPCYYELQTKDHEDSVAATASFRKIQGTHIS